MPLSGQSGKGDCDSGFMEIQSREDDWKYRACQGKLAGNYVSITMQLGGNLKSDKNSNLAQTLDSLGVVKIGNASWVSQTKLTPKEIVQLIRRHLQGDDYVHVFTLSGDLAWAGPLEACRLFNEIGIAANQCDEIPNPVDPSP